MIRIFIIITISILLTNNAFGQRTVRLTSGEWPPYISEKLPHYGYVSHLITKAFEAVDIKVEYGFFPWQRSLEYARYGSSHKGDIWHGSVIWTFTDERSDDFLYTDTVLYELEYLYHLTSTPLKWETIEDLQGKIIGATSYSVYYDFDKAEQNGIIKMQRAGSDENLIKRLLLKRFDAVPLVKGFADYYFRTKLSATDRSQITHSPTVVFDREFHILLGKKHDESLVFQGLFNQGLLILKENGEYDKLLQNLDSGYYDTP